MNPVAQPGQMSPIGATRTRSEMHQGALCPEAPTQPGCQSRIEIAKSIPFLGVLSGQFLLATVAEVWIPALESGVSVVIERVDSDLQ